MTKPPTSVRSIRLPEETWEWLAARAEKRGTTVNGLVAEGVMALRTGMISAKIAAKLSEPQAPKPARRETIVCEDGTRITGIGGVNVPLHKPKPFNPQPKKGKGK